MLTGTAGRSIAEAACSSKTSSEGLDGHGITDRLVCRLPHALLDRHTSASPVCQQQQELHRDVQRWGKALTQPLLLEEIHIEIPYKLLAGTVTGVLSTHRESETCPSSIDTQNGHAVLSILLELVHQLASCLCRSAAIYPDELDSLLPAGALSLMNFVLVHQLAGIMTQANPSCNHFSSNALLVTAPMYQEAKRQTACLDAALTVSTA